MAASQKMMARGLAVSVLVAVLCVAPGAVAQPSGASRTICNIGCRSGCRKISGSSNYECRSACKRGWARSASSKTCDVCAAGYATNIDVSLPRSVKRGFAACKTEPCKRCVACPRGTYSPGGAATLANDASKCVANGQLAFTQTIITSATGQPLQCNQGNALSTFMVASLRSRVSEGVALQPSPTATVTGASLVGSTCEYTVDVKYNGRSAVQTDIVAKSAQRVATADGYTGGVCDAYPRASGTLNLCNALAGASTPTYVTGTSTVPTNEVVPVSTFAQGVATASTVNSCQDSNGFAIASTMETSLENRDGVEKASVTFKPPCQLAPAPAGSYVDSAGVIHIAGYTAAGGMVMPGFSGGRRLLGATMTEGETQEMAHGGRALMQDSQQLYIIVYNMISVIIAATTPTSTPPPSVIEDLAKEVVAKALDPATVNQAFPLPSAPDGSVQLFTAAVVQATNQVVIVAQENNATAPPPTNNTDISWRSIAQTIVATNAAGLTCGQAFDVGGAMAASMLGSLAANVQPNGLAASKFPPGSVRFGGTDAAGCSTNSLGINLLQVVVYQGTPDLGNYLVETSDAAAFGPCNAYPAGNGQDGLCTNYASATKTLTGLAESVLCTTTGGNCPAPCTPAGTFRAGQQTATCDYILGGLYWTGSATTKCPVNTFAPTYSGNPAVARTKAEATLQSCQICVTGSSTDGATGQVECGFVTAGYFYDGSAPALCGADSYASGVRAIATATSCTPCPTGSSTFGVTGATAASACKGNTTSTVPAGSYWDGTNILPCEAGTFAPSARATTAGDARFCLSCNNLVAARQARQNGAGVDILLSTSSATGATSCSCPANTFFTSSGPTAVACVACPTGSTSGGDGAVGADACKSKCRQGYWGDPSSGAYNYQCRECPAVIGGDGSKSSTTGINDAGVTNVVCSTCVSSAAITLAGPPAACTVCPGNGASTDGVNCNTCKFGFSGSPGSCSQCPADFANTQLGVCGPGCIAGKTGGGCGTACTTKQAPAAYAAFFAGINSGTYVTNVQENDQCVWGCAPGTGLSYPSGRTCGSCGGSTYSPGATFDNPWPFCLTCPSGTVPIDGNSRCGLSGFGSAQPDGLFDEFD